MVNHISQYNETLKQKWSPPGWNLGQFSSNVNVQAGAEVEPPGVNVSWMCDLGCLAVLKINLSLFLFVFEIE